MKNIVSNKKKKTLTAKHSVGSDLEAGDLFQILSVSVSYSFS